MLELTMNRWLHEGMLAIVITVLTACASAPASTDTQPATSAPPAATPPPLALLWFRTSVEMQAAYHQAYRVAGSRIPELARGHASGSWAVILDADETVLDNSQWLTGYLAPGPEHPRLSWNDWVILERATALPGAKEFIEQVRASGGKAIVVTNRGDALCEATRVNLKKIGITVDGVLCATDKSNDKNARFESVQSGSSPLRLPPLAVVAYVGDSVADFPGKRQTEPDGFAQFGASFFVVPNPLYGAWSRNALP
jgi:5'-nucleotidase (lipoprotein e(P4) family)